MNMHSDLNNILSKKKLVFRPANFASVHTTSFKQSNLMEFFDDPKNFGASEVKSGRSWSLDELRIKSNIDLQKLWFVLLKERNMLLTMEYNSREACHLFPSPERIDKIQDSMSRLEQVIHERNDAYWQLEIGENAPKPRTVKSLDPTDPLAAVRDPIAAHCSVSAYRSVKSLFYFRVHKVMGAKPTTLLSLEDIDECYFQRLIFLRQSKSSSHYTASFSRVSFKERRTRVATGTVIVFFPIFPHSSKAMLLVGYPSFNLSKYKTLLHRMFHRVGYVSGSL
uniref:Large ribosomal subunit protein uL29m n=1 Tax=Daphnia atkinsoni TaxID=342845 RepID=A0A4Y7M253_9CRUS|nr:EOG090X0DBE [Daphnia atkinsoni]